MQDLNYLESPENKRDVTLILGSLGFYKTFIEKLHVDSKFFYEITKNDVPIEWTKEHEKLFQNIEDRIGEETPKKSSCTKSRSLSTLILLALVPDQFYYKSLQIENV